MTTSTIMTTLSTNIAPRHLYDDHLISISQSTPESPQAHYKSQPRGDERRDSAPAGHVAIPIGGLGRDTNAGMFGKGIGSSLLSCFPRFSIPFSLFPRSSSTKSIEDEWEIPFESVSSLQWVGSGSQGAVFSGILNGRVVAVKKVKVVEETEIKHLRDLKHPNITEFYGVCTQAPVFCIIMEFCPGGQLCEMLKSKRPIATVQWCHWVQEITEGMAFLHQNKVIHRDLKSQNILITEAGGLKICDFGTSHQQRKLDPTLMSFCGTVQWMAPEIIKKEPCNEKVDIFSYAVVIWEMLTRETPYKNIDPMAVIYGVGSNNLTLPIPASTPNGLRLLLTQCWSEKPRNRPSFTYIQKHIQMLKSDLLEMTEEEWFASCREWKAQVEAHKYPDTIVKGKHQGGRLYPNWDEQRRDEWKHIQDIRVIYTKKKKRTDKMYDELTKCMRQLELRELELNMRERDLQEYEQRISRSNSIASITKPMVVRMSNRGPGYHCSALPHSSSYGAPIATMDQSSDEEHLGEYCRGSPYRSSQASCSSGFQSFSRQSSSRSSAGAVNRQQQPLPQLPRQPRESPVRTHQSPFSREPVMRHSTSSHNWEMVRGSPARNSGCSEDSGFVQYYEHGSCQGLSHFNQGGTPISLSQTLYRNQDGRWSDGKIASRRKPRKPFQRDSPARQHSGRKPQRASYPSKAYEQDCDCGKPNCCRKTRARSMYDERAVHSPTPYDEPAELDVQSLSQNNTPQHVIYPRASFSPEAMHSPQSSMTTPTSLQGMSHSMSYQEALRDVPCQIAIYEQASPVVQEQVRGYDNPIYCSPTTTYINPMAEQCSPRDKMNNLASQPDVHRLSVLDNNIDLSSSIDSNNPRSVTRQSDASAESSGEEERNGNILESSLDSEQCKQSFRGKASSEDEDVTAKVTRRHQLEMDASFNMTSSLERSLELGAMHSDGLSDRETKVRAVKHTIKGHRRTHSNPQNTMSTVDETETSSSSEDSDASVKI